MAKNLTNKLPKGFTRRDLELTSEESKKRMKKIINYQRAIRGEAINYPSDLQKVYFPSYPIGH